MAKKYYLTPLKKEQLSVSEQRYLEAVDSNYGYHIAVKLTEFKATPSGFRLAGTDVENAAADWIAEEMKKIGLADVKKEDVTVDSWDFRGASLTVMPTAHAPLIMEAGSFPCIAGTSDEGVEGRVVYAGDGSAANYDNVDVTGKIVLIDTDGYHSYWYNSLFLQAELRGAKAIIATVTDQGPGTYRNDLITIQDTMTRIKIPAVMLNKGDGDKLRDMLKNGVRVTAKLKVKAAVTKGAKAHYVYGKISGKNPNRYIIVGGHYDAYWDGFLDNATSLGSTLTMAKAMIDSGYEPESTFIFISNGAEEYGLADTKYDFCTGAAQIIKDHPEWVENTVIYNNFELTAISQTENLELLGAAGYQKAFESVMSRIGLADGFTYAATSGVGADDGVYHKKGVPSYMNVCTHFSDDQNMESYNDPEAMENYDHTQYDNQERYNAEIFDFNNKIHGLINMAFDQCLFLPYDLSAELDHYREGISADELSEFYSDCENLCLTLDKVSKKAKEIYSQMDLENRKFIALKHCGNADEIIRSKYQRAWEHNRSLLKANWLIQNKIRKFDPFCAMIDGYTQPYSYVKVINKLIRELKHGAVGEAFETIMAMDNQFLILAFDQKVYQEVALNAFADSNPDSWGKGENMPFPDLYEVIMNIAEKNAAGEKAFANEIKTLIEIRKEQQQILVETLDADQKIFLDILDTLNQINIEEGGQNGKR